MTELLTAAQMRAIEHAAIDSGEVTGLDLMERAGQGVVDAIFERWPDYAAAPQMACVLCGPGNNGGDGYVVARLLQGRGWDIRVLALGAVEALPPDARVNAEIWCAENPVQPLTERALRARADTLVIDALFGTGLTRPLTGEAEAVMTHLSGRNGDDYSQKLLCIDAPSGLCLDSGKPIAAPFEGLNRCERRFATLTVAFDSPKAGHFLAQGPRLCGQLVVKDIGLMDWSCHQTRFASKDKSPNAPPSLSRQGPLRPASLTVLTERPMVPDVRHSFSFNRFADNLGRLGKADPAGHKFSHGHAVVASGPANRTGAARLAARAALRIGAGLVTVASPKDALPENAAQLTAVMLREATTPDQFRNLLSDARISSVCLGPGFARDGAAGELDMDHTRKMVEIALTLPPHISASGPGSSPGRSVVLDADALSTFATAPDQLFALLHANCVLTPHGGEFARLFPDIADRLDAPATRGPAYSKVDATRDAAARAGCTVLFKGPDTVIADSRGRAAIHSAQYDRAAPWLATAGSGDVLAGFITGLLARGFDPMRAAQTAAWLHVECALAFGPGLIAEDIPEQLPAVFRKLGL